MWGCTNVMLAAAEELTIRQALTTAWRDTARKVLVEEYDVEYRVSG